MGSSLGLPDEFDDNILCIMQLSEFVIIPQTAFTNVHINSLASFASTVWLPLFLPSDRKLLQCVGKRLPLCLLLDDAVLNPLWSERV